MAFRSIMIPGPAESILKNLFGSRGRLKDPANLGTSDIDSDKKWVPETNTREKRARKVSRYTGPDVQGGVPPVYDKDIINDRIIKADSEIRTSPDLVMFYIRDIYHKMTVQFRCTVGSINDNHSAEWSQNQHIGRPYPVHYYKGASRSVSFDFKTYAHSPWELQKVWKKINFLASLTHPADYVNGYMIPPYVELTLGNLFNRTAGYFNSITISINDEAGWDVGDFKTEPDNPAAFLPFMANINIAFTVIEKELKSHRSSLYGFEM